MYELWYYNDLDSLTLAQSREKKYRMDYMTDRSHCQRSLHEEVPQILRRGQERSIDVKNVK